jgi:hypothetical protein
LFRVGFKGLEWFAGNNCQGVRELQGEIVTEGKIFDLLALRNQYRKTSLALKGEISDT